MISPLRFLFFFLLLLNWRCSSYVRGIHHQIDRDEAQKNGLSQTNDPYAVYREQGIRKRRPDRRPIQDPRSLKFLSSQGTNELSPPIKRDYRPNNRRVTQKDFVDDGNGGSLWVDPRGGSLFTTENPKRVGDIVIINVADNLRSQISTELKRIFPDPKPKSSSQTKASDTDPKAPSTAESSSTKPGDPAKIYDKISSVISEEINNDYVLIKGKKEIIFRKQKRFIEVQALVAKKEIQDQESIGSDSLLESRVFVLR